MTFTAAFNGFTFNGPGGAFNGAATSGAAVVVTSYVDPDAGTLIDADDAGLDEVDPDAGSVITV